jgi:hypothetical protein
MDDREVCAFRSHGEVAIIAARGADQGESAWDLTGPLNTRDCKRDPQNVGFCGVRAGSADRGGTF